MQIVNPTGQDKTPIVFPDFLEFCKAVKEYIRDPTAKTP
jgi:hypothetical protein